MQLTGIEGVATEYDPLFAQVNNKYVGYGTAGFRMHGDKLFPIMYTVGFLAALRSVEQHGKAIGVMVTASHNAHQDNGVKLVDPSGEVLEREWESVAEKLANSQNAQELLANVEQIAKEHNIATTTALPQVFIAYDTRPTSIPLVNVLKQALAHTKATVVDMGLLTTPQLHFLVKLGNENVAVPKVDQYYSTFSKAYGEIVGQYQKRSIWIDCAYGVGGTQLQLMLPYLQDKLDVHLINVPTGEVNEHLKLNDQCGAEFAHKAKKVPRNFDLVKSSSMACFDGDADRIVYFLQDANYVLIDGDKIAALAATVFDNLLKTLGLQNELCLGVVQTAYANGASTIFIRQALGRVDAVSFAATGVKHLHHKAKEYDIGVYFESNGHGTVIFSNKCTATLAKKMAQLTSNEEKEAFARFDGLMNVINPTVGDAISDMLMVEAILATSNLTMQDWSSFYTDLPCVQTKAKVKDRNKIKTTADETQVTSPAGIQDMINAAVAAFKDPTARSFIRPSGTEDIVRVYAEASTQEIANKLANDVALIVYEHLDGTEKPLPL